VRVTLARELRDLRLLGSELVALLCAVTSHPLARRDQLAPGALGERLHADRDQHVVRRTQLLARIARPALAAQPLAVQQMRAGLSGCETAAAEPLDGLAVELLGDRALADERAGAGLDSEREFRACRLGPLGQPVERSRGGLAPAGARGRLDELG